MNNTHILTIEFFISIYTRRNASDDVIIRKKIWWKIRLELNKTKLHYLEDILNATTQIYKTAIFFLYLAWSASAVKCVRRIRNTYWSVSWVKYKIRAEVLYVKWLVTNQSSTLWVTRYYTANSVVMERVMLLYWYGVFSYWALHTSCTTVWRDGWRGYVVLPFATRALQCNSPDCCLTVIRKLFWTFMDLRYYVIFGGKEAKVKALMLNENCTFECNALYYRNK